MDTTTDAALVRRHARALPRYTSYPTANHFKPEIGPEIYHGWLAALATDQPISLYVHIPFCHALCHYCACNTKAVRRYDPVSRYVESVAAEIGIVAARHRARLTASHLHWGGGSPSMLEPGDIQRLAGAFAAAYDIDPDGENAVEVDPRHLREDQVAAFAAAGVNRVSFGVQDFDPAVQAAIGRLQDFAVTQRAVDLFRAHGVRSVNVDLVYGLPLQTLDSLGRTLDDVLRLEPERIATFGYAHLPERMRHQRLIDSSTLPGADDRYAQSQAIVRRLVDAGYARVGIDHFARSGDSLSSADLRRNFQGYTSDGADTLIGFGASAIGKLPGGFVQNSVAAGEYERRIGNGELATARGFAVSSDDRVRAFLIERLMCDFRVSMRALVDRFGEAARPVLARIGDVARGDADGLVTLDDDRLEVTERGRPFVRSICAEFDAYLGGSRARHSMAV
jgi:oxygen-independent coproporphyrinogen-3 oxidase